MKLRPTPFLTRASLSGSFWLALGALTHLYARAGGAGGHSSSSGGRSSGGGGFGGSHGSSSFGRSSYHGTGGSAGNDSISNLVFLILLGVVAYIVISQVRKLMASAPASSRGYEADVDSNSISGFLADYPDFDFAAFGEKVRSAFVKIQSAWTAQNVSQIRPFITDGMYQRFATQFRMMGLLKQQNRLDRIQVLRVEPVSARVDGAFDVIDVYVEAAMHDAFVCELDHSFDSESNETFVEYWSFIRKRGAGGGGFSLFENTNCPSCGAALPKDMGELCRCSYCQVIVNSGDFDWILAEITQETDYGNNSLLAPLVSPQLPQSIAAIDPECPDFSVQLAEDKASNAFMQIMTAMATRNPASVRRFVSDEVFAKFSTMIPDRNIIFNRIYLNESVLLDVSRNETRHQLAIGLSASMQRVEILANRNLAPIDFQENRSGHVLLMERDANAVPEKGSLYQHQCATCGGAVGDTLDVNCQYCGSPLNSTRNEWIVTGFSTLEEYSG